MLRTETFQVYNIITDTFDLKNETEHVQKNRLKSIFKSKGKNLPDIRITPTPSHANRFLTWVAGKSASVDNLSDSVLRTQLKEKSHSSNEIFSGHQETKRESSSHNLVVGDSATSRVDSYGSCDTLHPRVSSPEVITQSVDAYHCPYSLECKKVLKGK